MEWCESHDNLERDIKEIKSDVGDIKGSIGEINGFLKSDAIVTGKYLHSELQKVYGRINTIITSLVVVILGLGGALAYILKTIP